MDKKIMIIGRDKKFLKWLKGILTLAGYRVYASDNENSVVDAVFEVNPDVVLFDFARPGKIEILLAGELRRLSKKFIPVTARPSCYDATNRIKLMRTCGVKTCLTKPFNPLDVIARIEMFPEPGYVEETREFTEPEKGGDRNGMRELFAAEKDRKNLV